jgi:hypothetical protein
MPLVLEPNAAVPVTTAWREKARRAIQQAHDAGDMSPEEWEGFVDGLLKFLSEEAQEPEHAQDAMRPVVNLPSDADGMFVEPEELTPDVEMSLAHNRERFANHFNYADNLGAGNQNSYDERGDYNCGRCNQAQGDKCLLLDIRRIDRTAGSCEDWEKMRLGDPEMRLDRKSPDVANYGVAENGIGFGCARCPYSRQAKNTDSEGRSHWCGEGGFHIIPTACCTANGAPTVEDATGAEDEAMKGLEVEDAATLALDRESVRTKDVDGRLHVADVPLCRESVDPYKGSEVPGYRKLGLDPEKIYHLWRPAEELEKALPTISGIPVLRKHVATSAEDHKSKDTIGAVGTSARWEAPFIVGELVIWPAEDIELIENKEKFSLSPGYRYVPVMEVGNFNGTAYDGKMTAIQFNHLAVVSAGRQSEVAIDSSEELQWSKLEAALLALRVA